MSEEEKAEKIEETYVYYKRALSFLSKADDELADAVLFFKHAHDLGAWREQCGISHKDSLAVYLHSLETSIKEMKSLIGIDDVDKYIGDCVEKMKEEIASSFEENLVDEIKKNKQNTPLN